MILKVLNKVTYPNNWNCHDLCIFLSFLSQKLAFMVSLGLVTHDHLEGKKKKNVLSCFLSSLSHSHSEWELQVQHIPVFSVVFSCTKVLWGCLYSWSNWSLLHAFYSSYYMEAKQLLMQLRSEGSVFRKKAYALMVGKKFVTILLHSKQPLYL